MIVNAKKIACISPPEIQIRNAQLFFDNLVKVAMFYILLYYFKEKRQKSQGEELLCEKLGDMV